MKFSKKEAVNFGFEAAKKNFVFFLVVIFLMWFLNFLPSYISKPDESKNTVQLVIIFVTVIAAWLLRKLFDLGVIQSTLNVVDGKKPVLSDLFARTEILLKAIAGDILYGLIVLAGMVLLIVPGIIWAIKYQYYSYLIVDKGMGPLEALKESGKITQGVKWDLFIFDLLLGLINILGAILVLVGLLITIPLTMVAGAYVYRKLAHARHTGAEQVF